MDLKDVDGRSVRNSLEAEIRQQVHGWENLASSEQSVVVTDMSVRFCAHSDNWYSFSTFVRNYISTVKAYIGREQWTDMECLATWASVLIMLNG